MPHLPEHGGVELGGERHASTADALAALCRDRRVTLVLGAGVSRPLGVPGWDDLARRAFEATFPGRPSPWDASGPGPSPRQVPQFLPIAFELVANELGPNRFVERLRELVYADVPRGWTRGLRTSRATLPALARAILREHRAGPGRSLARVVTFNVDDLLEETILRLQPRSSAQPFDVVARPSKLGGADASGVARIPIYHVHGYVPMEPVTPGGGSIHEAFFDSSKRSFDHMLVFTDLQYWRSTATPLSLANRVVANALSDSHCVFVGLSMTDANVLRWLALRRLELEGDSEQRALARLTDGVVTLREVDARYGRRGRGAADRRVRELFRSRNAILRAVRGSVDARLPRHFWIRPASDDPGGFLGGFLAARGVLPVEIDGWDGPALDALLRRCFRARARR